MKKIFYILIILFILYSTSTDYPQTQWQLLGLNNEDVTKIVIHPNESKTLFAGSRSDFSLGSVGALFKSTNSGITWDTLISVITVRDIVINPVNPDIIYIAAGANAGNNPGVIKTTDGGNTWFNADSGVIVDAETNVNTISIDPDNPEILYCGTGGFIGGNLYKTINGGNDWFIPSADSIFGNGVMVIEFDPYDFETLYVGRSWDGKLSRSNDGGTNWEYAGYTNGGSIRALEFGTSSDEMYIASWWSFDYPVGIFKTTDKGITWNNLGEEFKEIANVRDVKVNFTIEEHIYIGLDTWYDQSGVYVRKDNQQWEYLGLNNMIINSLELTSNSIYAVTSEGLYISDLVTNINEDNTYLYESSYLLFPAYPNPFNSATTIEYSIKQDGLVSLKVYDVLGAEVISLVNANQVAGKYSVQFDASSLTSGNYIYRLISGQFTSSKKLILLK